MKKVVSLILVLCMALTFAVPAFAADEFEPFKITVTRTGALNGVKRLVVSLKDFPFTLSAINQLKGCLLNGTATYTGDTDCSKSVPFKDVVIEASDIRGDLTAIDFKVPEGYKISSEEKEDKFYTWDLTLSKGTANFSETAPTPAAPTEPVKPIEPTSFSMAADASLLCLSADSFAETPGAFTLAAAERGSFGTIVFAGPKPITTEDEPATANVKVEKDGTYYIWARALDFAENQPGTRNFTLSVNDKELETKGGTHKTEGWAWQLLGTQDLKAGTAKIAFVSATAYGRCTAIALTTDKDIKLPTDEKETAEIVQKYLTTASTEAPVTGTEPGKTENKLDSAVILFLGSPEAIVKGEKTFVDANNNEVAPFTENDRTLVPVRFISENLGAEVGWDEETKTVTVTTDKKVVKLVLGLAEMDIDGVKEKIDVPANTYNDRTFLPLRAMAETVMGKKVFWDERGLIIISDIEMDAVADKALVDETVAKFSK